MATLTLSAAPPEKTPLKPEEPPVPLFQPPAEIKPDNLATLTIGNSFTPQAGLWSAIASLYGGAHPDYQVWSLNGPLSSRPGRMQLGAATLFLNGFGPGGQASLRMAATLPAGEDRGCWNLINTDEVRRFPKFFLEPGRIRDRHDLNNGDPEIEIYAQVIIMAHFTSAEAFARVARRDLTYTHLFLEPERHRGEVVHIANGRLRRLQRFDPPDEARAAGVNDLYEGWLFTDKQGEHPLVVAFTDLPPGLKIEGQREINVEGVTFDGYFYKRYRYKAGDTKKHNEFRDAPLLIGHTLTLPTTPVEPDTDNWGHHLIFVFLGVVGGALVAVIGVTFWFRYHDRRIRNRILASRNREYVPPAEEPPPNKGEPTTNGNGDTGERPEREAAGPGRPWGEFPQSLN